VPGRQASSSTHTSYIPLFLLLSHQMFVSHEPNIFKTAHHGRSRGRKFKKEEKENYTYSRNIGISLDGSSYYSSGFELNPQFLTRSSSI
jgi:hypothetical protein